MTELPDDWYEEHSGQRLVLDQNKVSEEIDRLHREIARLTGALQQIADEFPDSAGYTDGTRIAIEALRNCNS